MVCMTEAMGMSLPGCAATPAVDAGKLRLARETGEAILPLVKKGIKPRDIITKKSLRNAIRVDMALGGSTNMVLHLMAIAVEAEIPLTLDDFSSLADEIPHLCYMQPSGPHSMQTPHRSGGIPAVLKRLESYLDDSVTVSGKKILQIAKDASIRNEEVIRSIKIL
jgi:dihydroxy-acid dehydratase